MPKTLSKEEKQQLIRAYRKLSVADVRDGMDRNRMHHIGSIYTDSIKPLFRTRFFGFARTVRFTPADKIVSSLPPDWSTEIEEDDIVVIDAGDADVGVIGTANGLAYKNMGARGVITNGGALETDGLTENLVPVFSRYANQTQGPGRAEFQAAGTPVNINGTLIRPGDFIMADEDGIVVVPIEKAWDVVKYAMQDMESDKRNRWILYGKMSMELDEIAL